MPSATCLRARLRQRSAEPAARRSGHRGRDRHRPDGRADYSFSALPRRSARAAERRRAWALQPACRADVRPTPSPAARRLSRRGSDAVTAWCASSLPSAPGLHQPAQASGRTLDCAQSAANLSQAAAAAQTGSRARMPFPGAGVFARRASRRGGRDQGVASDRTPDVLRQSRHFDRGGPRDAGSAGRTRWTQKQRARALRSSQAAGAGRFRARRRPASWRKSRTRRTCATAQAPKHRAEQWETQENCAYGLQTQG